MVFEVKEIFGLPIVVDEDVEELRMPSDVMEFLSKVCKEDCRE